MKKLIVFDNEGETTDRYTVIGNDGEMMGFSENPTHPMGFSQYCGNCIDNYMFVSFGYAWRRQCDVKKVIKNELPRIIQEFKTDGNIGKQIEFKTLPIKLQEHIIYRFKNQQ